MKARHVPSIDPRYWVGILCASIFGTNMGDFYAHESGLGIGLGLLLLCALFAVVYAVEVSDTAPRELYYWLAIIIVRTGATNIADFLAFRVRIPQLLLSLGLAALIALFGWIAGASRRGRARPLGEIALSDLHPTYWAAMLGAGVFGTVVGDVCSHQFGEGPSAAVLTTLLLVALAVLRDRAARLVAVYWCAVALARTAGTCLGDWLAETPWLHIGLPLSTLLTGVTFVAVLSFWRSPRRAPQVAA